MDLEDILQSRNRQIAECRDLIMYLDNIEDSDERNELKSLLHRKKDLLVELNTENYQYTIKELKIINEKIYVSSNIIINKITKLQEFQRLNPILAKLATKKKDLKIIDIFKFALKYQFITTFIFFLIGGFIFGIYFKGIDYFPLLNKESFIYFLFFLSTTGILYAFLFLFIPIVIPKIFSKIFQIQYMKKDEKILFIFLTLLIPIIIFIFTDPNKTQIILSLGMPLAILYISYRFSSNFANLLKILISISVIFILMLVFMSLISQLYKEVSQYKIFFSLLLILIPILAILFVINQKLIELILYVIYIVGVIFVLILTSSDVMKLLHLGNYTPDALILKPEAKDIIPSDFLHSNNTLKKPKILSNIGDEYYIELKTTLNKALRLSIPKNLVLSEQNEVEEKVDEAKDTKEQSKPEESVYQKIYQWFLKALQSTLKHFCNSAD